MDSSNTIKDYIRNATNTVSSRISKLSPGGLQTNSYLQYIIFASLTSDLKILQEDYGNKPVVKPSLFWEPYVQSGYVEQGYVEKTY